MNVVSVLAYKDRFFKVTCRSQQAPGIAGTFLAPTSLLTRSVWPLVHEEILQFNDCSFERNRVTTRNDRRNFFGGRLVF